MPSVSITDPTPDSTVGWTFPASGGYDTAPSAGDPGGQVGLSGAVVCTLYDSDSQPVQVRSYPLPPEPTAGTWLVGFEVDQDYPGCTLTAILQLPRTPAVSDSVSPVNVVGS